MAKVIVGLDAAFDFDMLMYKVSESSGMSSLFTPLYVLHYMYMYYVLYSRGTLNDLLKFLFI